LGLSFGLVQVILRKDFGTKCISVKLSQNCWELSRKRLTCSSQSFAAVCWSRCKLHDDLITSDEPWVYRYDPET
jgi:hypothetical protein